MDSSEAGLKVTAKVDNCFPWLNSNGKLQKGNEIKLQQYQIDNSYVKRASKRRDNYKHRYLFVNETDLDQYPSPQLEG